MHIQDDDAIRSCPDGMERLENWMGQVNDNLDQCICASRADAETLLNLVIGATVVVKLCKHAMALYKMEYKNPPTMFVSSPRSGHRIKLPEVDQ